MKKGFLLMEIILSIFFIGLIATVFLPIFGMSINNMNRIKSHNHMNYIGEMVAENLRASEPEKNPYISQLMDFGSAVYTHNDIDEIYECNIYKLNTYSNLMDILVVVNYKNGLDGGKVSYETTIFFE